jgi:hypothetical protein
MQPIREKLNITNITRGILNCKNELSELLKKYNILSQGEF